MRWPTSGEQSVGEYQGTSGNIREYLEISGNICGYRISTG